MGWTTRIFGNHSIYTENCRKTYFIARPFHPSKYIQFIVIPVATSVSFGQLFGQPSIHSSLFHWFFRNFQSLAYTVSPTPILDSPFWHHRSLKLRSTHWSLYLRTVYSWKLTLLTLHQMEPESTARCTLAKSLKWWPDIDTTAWKMCVARPASMPLLSFGQ